MGIKDKVKKGTLKTLEDLAETYKNGPLKGSRKSTNRSGYTYIGFPLKESSLRKLNLVTFHLDEEKQTIRERAIEYFLTLYDEDGKRLKDK